LLSSSYMLVLIQQHRL